MNIAAVLYTALR